jgi:Flp pilus assembly pilin Flp
MSFLLLHVASTAFGSDHMLNLFKHFLKNESGVAAVEYGLIVSGISGVVIPSVHNVGLKLVEVFTKIENAL